MEADLAIAAVRVKIVSLLLLLPEEDRRACVEGLFDEERPSKSACPSTPTPSRTVLVFQELYQRGVLRPSEIARGINLTHEQVKRPLERLCARKDAYRVAPGRYTLTVLGAERARNLFGARHP